jgi:two-component system sensor histidine kinase HydH
MEMSTRLLLEKGEALIRSFEAGARAGEGMAWGSFQLQKLLIETAQQPGVDYLIITDTEGRIVTDSDPGMVGDAYGTDLDLAAFSAGAAQWRIVTGAEGPDTFEVYRRFAPREEPYGGFNGQARGASYVIFVGLNMAPVQAAHDQDTRNTIITAAVLLLISIAGIVSLLLALGYRSARASLSRVKALSDTLVEHMPVGIVAVDSDERVMVFNDTAEKLLGRTSTEVIGKPSSEILPPPCMDMLRELGKERLIVEKELVCAVGEGRRVPLEVIAAVLRDDEGALIGRIALVRDLSELQHLRSEVERSRRLAAVGSLAAGVAHEIRNPLSSLKGFATYFRQRYGGVPDDVKIADIMIQEVDRLNRVISELLEFSRPMELKRTKKDLAGLVRHTLGTIEGQLRDKGSPKMTCLPDFRRLPSTRTG